jgi:hypothetical protein
MAKSKNKIIPQLMSAIAAMAVSKAIPKNKKKKAPKKQKQNKKVASQQVQSYYAPSAVGTTYKRRSPQFSGGNNTFRVQHTEMVSTTLAGSVGFTQQLSLSLNPSLPSSFPWLAPIAANFTYFRFRGVYYDYIPYCSSSTTGSIQMAPDYDAADAVPYSEIIFSSYKDYVDGNVWGRLRCSLSPESLNKFSQWHFCSNLAPQGQFSSPIYAPANMLVYTNNCANSNSIGKIEVTYDIEFSDPALPPSGNISSYTDSARSTVGLSTASPLIGAVFASGGSQEIVFSANINGSGSSGATFSVPGIYLITMYIKGTVITSIGVVTAGGSATINALIPATIATGSTSAFIQFDVVVAQPGDYFTWNSVVATTLTESYVNITNVINNSLLIP